MKKLKSNFLREIGNLSRAIHYMHDIHLKQLNLQKGQFIFLTRVCENEGICFKTLSELLKVDKTTTSKAIQKLIEAGYITKDRDTTDKREFKLYPTEKAKKIYDFIIEEENHHIDICFENIEAEDFQKINEVLKKINCNYEKEWQNKKR